MVVENRTKKEEIEKKKKEKKKETTYRGMVSKEGINKMMCKVHGNERK